MTSDLLVDTCVAIWLVEGLSLSRQAATALNDCFDGHGFVVISAVTAWEFGMLEARGRLGFASGALDAYKHLCALPGTRSAELTPEILVASSNLPGAPHGDPFDRILMATARAMDLTVLTSDRKILACAEAGFLAAIPCHPIRT